MNSDVQFLNLIDLISERHVLLRKTAEKMWNDNSDLYISNSEWFILARVYQSKQTTISTISKQVDISRQATHKFIKRLKEKGLVEIDNLENNKKEKCIRLTALGYSCLEINESLKEKLESIIAEKIGAEQLNILKEIFRLDWGL